MINKHKENDITYSSPSIHYILYILSFPHTCLSTHSFAFGRAGAKVLSQRPLLIDLEIKKDLTVNSIIHKYFFFTCYAHII